MANLTVPDLTLRLVKGTPLTAAEMDSNLSTLKDFANSLSDLLAASLNTDGSLKDDTVGEGSLSDRSVTARKLSSTALPYFVDTSSTPNAFTIAPDPVLLEYTAGQVFFIRAANTTVTAPCTVSVNGLTPKPLLKLGGEDLSGGDLEVDQVFCCVYNGSSFFVVSNVNRNFSMPSGSLVNHTETSSGDIFLAAALTPAIDDTTPEDTEGNNYDDLDTSFTPASATNILEIEVFLPVNNGVAGTQIVTLFWDKDSPTVALAVGCVTVSASGYGQLLLKHRMVAGYSSLINFKVRVGCNAGVVNVNGAGGVHKFSGANSARLSIKEFVA